MRTYAEAIGLNPEETVEEFAAGVRGDRQGGRRRCAADRRASRQPLRLALVEESPIELDGLGRRAALAAADLLIGSLIAAIASVGLGRGVWVTVALILGYFTLGRLISDEPLLYHAYRRLRTRPPAPAVAEDASDEVAPVGRRGENPGLIACPQPADSRAT